MLFSLSDKSLLPYSNNSTLRKYGHVRIALILTLKNKLQCNGKWSVHSPLYKYLLCLLLKKEKKEKKRYMKKYNSYNQKNCLILLCLKKKRSPLNEKRQYCKVKYYGHVQDHLKKEKKNHQILL